MRLWPQIALRNGRQFLRGQVATDPDGNVIVVSNADGAVPTSTPGVFATDQVQYLFRLDQNDGSLVE